MKNTELRKSLVALGEYEQLTEPSVYNLINRVNKYACLNLEELSIECLRLLISQEIGLEYCVPLALNKLNDKFLAEGDFYEGDLFIAISSLNSDSWDGLRSERELFTNIIRRNVDAIIQNKLDRKLNSELKALLTN